MQTELLYGVIIGIETMFILILYERLIRLSRKIGEKEGIDKGRYFQRKEYGVVKDYTSK